MLFNSFQFLWLFPILFIGYYLLTYLFSRHWSSLGNMLLIVVSYLLYMNWKPAYACILFGVTLITYVFARVIDSKKQIRKGNKILIFAGVFLSLLPLLVFKYYNFVNTSISELLAVAGLRFELPGLNWAVPVGISFFTFQAVGYLWDVYYKRIPAEKNWWHYMLFVSFFPQIASGPISKAADLLPQIKAQRIFNYDKAVQGLKWLLWGMFLKVVLADRLGLYVDSVYSNYIYQSGLSCMVASILYSFQIYGDFAGYSLMAIGVGRLMGFDLINNFNRPYLSASVTEFWHRWHISLSVWLKDYVYIPLGGSRCSKLRNYWNIFITFLVSGIWHGANWTFIVWGIWHGLFQILEKMFRLQKCNSKGGIKVLRILITFILVNFAWIFFRMPTLHDAWQVILKIFTDSNLNLFLPEKDVCLYIIVALLLLILKDIRDEYFSTKFLILKKYPIILRYSFYAFIIILILSIGVLDASTFIYFQF